VPQPQVRPAKPSDLAAVAAIYADFVHSSTATFDEHEPPMSTWQAMIDRTGPGNHFLVAVDPSSPREGTVVGYAYSAKFRRRPAYSRTRETSIYVAPQASGRGYGSLLYEELISLLRRDEIHLAIAVVAQPNPASNAIHRKVGFTEVGTLDEVGYKFGSYVSTTWFQLRLT
jgi:L-amino acid N-acyltransferase YncA